ncbi:MAG: hypothetical protein ACYDHX_02585 [Methanothrix sp.]
MTANPISANPCWKAAFRLMSMVLQGGIGVAGSCRRQGVRAAKIEAQS